MKLLKQKTLFLLYFAQIFVPAGSFRKEARYLSYNFFYKLLLPFFKAASIRKAIGELTAGGEVDKIVRNHQSFFRLTVLGEKQIRGLFTNFFFQQVKARGWFLAVIRSQKNVRQIRQNIRKLGFIKLKKGVYLFPAKRQFAKNLERLMGKVFFVFVPKLEFSDEKQLVGKLWNLDQYYKENKNFVIRAQKLLSKLNSKNRLSKKEINSTSALSENFFILIKNTIGLPKNLLPDDWPLPKGTVIFSKILKIAFL